MSEQLQTAINMAEDALLRDENGEIYGDRDDYTAIAMMYAAVAQAAAIERIADALEAIQRNGVPVENVGGAVQRRAAAL